MVVFHRMMVAEKMKLDSRASVVVAHNTSMIDLSPGQLSLVSLMFAPFVEFRWAWAYSLKPQLICLRSPASDVFDISFQFSLSADKKGVSGLLCGLGYTRDGETVTPLFPDHDMDITSEVELFESDIRHVSDCLRQTESKGRDNWWKILTIAAVSELDYLSQKVPVCGLSKSSGVIWDDFQVIWQLWTSTANGWNVVLLDCLVILLIGGYWTLGALEYRSDCTIVA